MPATTSNRIETNTSDSLNRKFDEQLKATIAKYAGATPAAIDEHLRELDREWNIERVIEMEAPSVILLGAVLGPTLSRKWYVLSALAASMVILHSVRGWYPLLPLLRRLGIRSQNEIEQERSALRALRGDHAAYQPNARHQENIS